MSIQGKKTSHKQKSMVLNLKQTIPQCVLIMVCRIIHKVGVMFRVFSSRKIAPDCTSQALTVGI